MRAGLCGFMLLIFAPSSGHVFAAEEYEIALPSELIASAGSQYSVSIAVYHWYDARRSRPVPVTVYLPNEIGQAPVVLFSHGLGRSREAYGYLGHYWAAHGYVAVLIEHLGSNDEVWRGKLRPKKALKEAYADLGALVSRPIDVSFAMDELYRQRTEHTRLGLTVDLERIGVAGNDLGALTALALAGEKLPHGRWLPDPRVKAIIAMSPPILDGLESTAAAYQHIHIPCLHMTGTADDGKIGSTRAGERRIPFDQIRGADQYLVTFVGGDHMIYSGHQRQRGNAQSDAMFQRRICSISTAFWDGYLMGDPEARARLAVDGLKKVAGNLAYVEKKLVGTEVTSSW